MPPTLFSGATGGFSADRVHKGPGQVSKAHWFQHARAVLLTCFNQSRSLQAGNKSALTYRCDIGVPGYTGYIPQTAAVPLQVKGSTKHTGDLCCPVRLLTCHTLCQQFCTTPSELSTTCYRHSYAGRVPTITHQQEATPDVPDFHTTTW